jgi:hypothetical protein
MRKLFSLVLACLLLTGCVTDGVKPSKIPTIKPLPSKALVITQPRQPTNIVQTVPTNKPFFTPARSPRATEQAPKIATKITSNYVVTNHAITNSIATNVTTTNAAAKQPSPKKKDNGIVKVAYSALVLSLISFWFFFGRGSKFWVGRSRPNRNG